LLAGRLPVAEVTLRVDGALEALQAMASRDITVGSGTVVTTDQVDRAVDAGAAFLVSPGLHTPVVERCRSLMVPVLPGVATPSDVMRAVKLGVETVKLFPADLIDGPAAVKARAGPFPVMRFVPPAVWGRRCCRRSSSSRRCSPSVAPGWPRATSSPPGSGTR